MKTIVCEICGNNNLIKQDGMFMCQSCGTKYSVEEVKNLIVEIGESPVTNANTTNNGLNQISKFIDMAEVAMKAGNLKEAIDYTNKALEIDNKNYYAYYLKGLSIAYQTTIATPKFEEGIKYMLVGVDYVGQDKKAELQELIATSAYKILSNHLGLIGESYGKDLGATKENIDECLTQIYGLLDVLDEKGCVIDKNKFFKSIGERITSAGITYWYESFYPAVKNSKKTFYNKDILALVHEYGDVCALLKEATIMSKDKALNIRCYENLINISNEFMTLEVEQPSGDYEFIKPVLHKDAKKLIVDNIMEWHKAWNEVDNTHQIPERPKAGCYVATCVYGSYDCPQVWTLRRYRDNTLGATWYGRAFIKIYYAISPTLVKWFGHTKWFKKMWQGKLDRMVKKLNDQGVKDTPYYDNYL